MADVFITADNILSPIGVTTADNFERLKAGKTGVRKHYNKLLADEPFYASLFDGNEAILKGNTHYTKFERLIIASITDALKQYPCNLAHRTALIICSTKGNISLLETGDNTPVLKQRISLSASAKLIADHFGFTSQPLVISNACISGLMGIITGKRLILSGEYDNVVITGADEISKFILSGFGSFQAISSGPCKPFDIGRDGITLGEGAATMILSAHQNSGDDVKVTGGAVSNDANHISAPSRTGEELKQAITKSLAEANLGNTDIDFISAHGTATVYNDEMEAKAITLANMRHIPLNSLKGYYGHTLGAAGLIESIIAIQSLKQNIMIPSLGFEETGTTDSLNICTELLSGHYQNCLKTASGFGGCNAAVIFSKK
ncbi:beta-ketoacyl synthase N-terminal-like domain-containing protein [Mucilaginibacter gilvus]|uniref:Beta-ketoacyl synthase n=1 Tax=Mucilaginibacter gilvus TaxID=2305909 RepID=A0A444MKN5_9SPHI|nr:beta-ketoacyl synthase N-terminal-like domain-containing protein [Mucilaginibacter gilvus]RWY49406.1 beta-ketoacyl synthase [Mucilaginibacter gilvus]